MLVLLMSSVSIMTVNAGAATTWTKSNAPQEFYTGKDYATNWRNTINEPTIYGDMMWRDSINSSGNSGVWAARKGNFGTWTTACKHDDIIGKKEKNRCISKSSDNKYKSFDTHGKWNSLKSPWKSISSSVR